MLCPKENLNRIYKKGGISIDPIPWQYCNKNRKYITRMGYTRKLIISNLKKFTHHPDTFCALFSVCYDSIKRLE